MALMKKRYHGNEYRTTVVCVDSYQNGVPVGRFYNPALKEGQGFDSLSRFLISMEDFLDGINLPQSFTTARSFGPSQRAEGTATTDKGQSGKLATFAVRILFRQNASWQGSVTWLEGKREESFRSVLELILLMDSALNEA